VLKAGPPQPGQWSLQSVGYKKKFNTGFFAIVFAYLIGCFVMGMKTKDVIAKVP